MLRHLRLRFRTGLKLCNGCHRAPKQCVVTKRTILWHGRGLHTSRILWSPATVKPFLLSDIGEGIKQVVIKQWHVKEGDTVEEFDDICDVESDKAFTTITSKYKGVVRKIYHNLDGVAQVGAPLVDIEMESDSIESTTPETIEASVKMAETEKVQEVKEESIVESSIEKSRADGQPRNETLEAEERKRSLATPAVRRLVRENKLDLTEIRGSGKEGRVLKEDVLSFIDNNKANRRRDETDSHYEQLKSIQAAANNQDMVFRVEGLCKHMVRSMTVSGSIPTLTYCDEVNVTTLARWRSEFREALAKRDIKLSFLPFIMKAMSLSILKYPIVNATLDEKCEKITYKSAHNIGFAVATSKGLLVPNVKNVRNLSILQIALELARLQSLAHAGSLSPSDISGGTITISNLGSIGGIYYRPLINPPEVVIGATGKVQVLPRYNAAGDIEKTHVINVSWAADHRIIDGATMANFSNTWKDYMENPAALLLGLV